MLKERERYERWTDGEISGQREGASDWLPVLPVSPVSSSLKSSPSLVFFQPWKVFFPPLLLIPVFCFVFFRWLDFFTGKSKINKEASRVVFSLRLQRNDDKFDLQKKISEPAGSIRQ